MDGVKMTRRDLAAMSPAVLAYIGDAVYEVFVRSRQALKGPTRINDLHKEVVKMVNASTQAKLLHYLENVLTEEEKNVARRGRNVNTGKVPKNANTVDYRHSTGLECLIGYLYLLGEEDRLEELISLLDKMDVEKGDER